MLNRLTHWLLGGETEFGTSMSKHPWETLGKVLLLLGLIAVSAVILNWIMWLFGPHELRTLFRDSKTVYSNVLPIGTDIVDLDHAGTLTPSPYNNISFAVSSEYACGPNSTALPYSEGMVLILNLSPTFIGSTPESERGIRFNPASTTSSDYFVFKPGTTNEVKTGGRIFLIKLSSMTDLFSPKNGPYFSYTFDINEQ